MNILTHKQSKGCSSIIEYERLPILRNWLSKTLAVNSFKYRMIKGGGGGDSQKITFDHKGGGGVQRGPKCDHAILEQPLIQVKLIGVKLL